jgi:hypothetical protein
MVRIKMSRRRRRRRRRRRMTYFLVHREFLRDDGWKLVPHHIR